MNKKLKKGLTVSSAAAMGMSIVLPTVSVIAAPAVTNGWVNQNGTWYYYNNGTLVKNGWAKDSKGWAFLSAVDGSWVQEGWAKDSTGWGYIRNGYWVEHATYAKDANGWEFIGANGYWDSSVAPSATNPIDDATAAVVKAEGSKLAADVDAAKALVAKLNDAVPEKAALTTRLNAVVTNFEVASVTVVDATHIKVVFTQAVDEDTATDTDNYSFSAVDDNDEDLGINEAEIDADGKTVIIKLDSEKCLTNDSDVDYTVKITDIENASGDVIDDYKNVVSLYDDVKPTIESVTLTDSDTIQVKFSEDIDESTITKSNIEVLDEDGNEIDVAVDPNDDDDSIIDITGVAGEDEGTYTVSVKNVKDLAGNKVVATTEDVDLSEDDSDPDVVSVKPVSYSTLKVTFDEAIDIDEEFTLSIDGDNVDLDFDNSNTNDFNVEEVDGSSKKSYYVTVDDDLTDNTINYDDDSSHKIKISGYKDFAGNEGDDYSKFLKFSDVAPALESTAATIKTYDGDKYAVFTMDTDVNGFVDDLASDFEFDGSFVDEDGDEVDVTLGKSVLADADSGDDISDDLDDNQFAIALSGLDVGDYTMTLPDKFMTINGAEFDETDVTFSVTTETEDDVYVDGFGKSTTDTDVYYVHFSDEVGSSALDVSNYEIDGDNVFASAKFTTTDKDEVKLTVDQGAIEDIDWLDTNYNFTAEDIVDANGNDVADFDSADGYDVDMATHGTVTFATNTELKSGKDVEITETCGPEVDDVVLVDLDTITVTFDELVYNWDGDKHTGDIADGDIDEDDFRVLVNGDEVDIESVDSTDGITFTITLDDEIDSDEDYTVKAGTSKDFDGEDKYGNDGKVSVKTADTDEDAPVITGVEDGKTYNAAVTPKSVDKDIDTVVLTNGGTTVDGYDLGDEITTSGTYKLTVTDVSGNKTVVDFTVTIV